MVITCIVFYWIVGVYVLWMIERAFGSTPFNWFGLQIWRLYLILVWPILLTAIAYVTLKEFGDERKETEKLDSYWNTYRDKQHENIAARNRNSSSR
jgi:hypothetical protein